VQVVSKQNIVWKVLLNQNVTKYKRTIEYVNMCSNVHDYIIKLKMLKQVLVLKDKDPKHV